MEEEWCWVEKTNKHDLLLWNVYIQNLVWLEQQEGLHFSNNNSCCVQKCIFEYLINFPIFLLRLSTCVSTYEFYSSFKCQIVMKKFNYLVYAIHTPMFSIFGDKISKLSSKSRMKCLVIIPQNKNVLPTYVVILAEVTRVAWNVNKFCVYEVSIPHFMLSNIADTVNKHTMIMAE